MLSSKYQQNNVMDTTWTLSAKFLSSPYKLKLTSLLSQLEFTSMIQVSQQHLLKCEGDLDNVLHSSWLSATDTAVLILLTSKVSDQSFKLPFIPSKVWSCYSVLYFSIFALWFFTLLSLLLSLEITDCCVLGHHVFFLRTIFWGVRSSKLIRN